MSYQARVDELACAVHGNCEVVAPQAFEVREVATVIGTAPDELLLEAARGCPTAAISLIDVASGRQVFPPEASPS